MTSGVDSFVTVSGASDQFKVDSYVFGDEYRQVVVLGGVDASGNIVNVNPSGALEVSSINPSLSVNGNLGVSGNFTLSSVFIDEDTTGGNPQTNTLLVNAPGAGKKLVVHGYNLTFLGTTSSSLGRFLISNGTLSGSETTGNADVLIAGLINGNGGHNMSNFSSYGIHLSENLGLYLSTTEATPNIFLYGTLWYSKENV